MCIDPYGLKIRIKTSPPTLSRETHAECVFVQVCVCRMSEGAEQQQGQRGDKKTTEGSDRQEVEKFPELGRSEICCFSSLSSLKLTQITRRLPCRGAKNLDLSVIVDVNLVMRIRVCFLWTPQQKEYSSPVQ